MDAKERAALKLFEYLGNPENEFLARGDLSTLVLGYEHVQQIHNIFTADEIQKIEKLALEIRRKKYAVHLAKADIALFKEAEGGDVQAIKLAYQRFEDWSEKRTIDTTITPGEGLKEIINEMWEQSGMEKPENG